MEQRCSAEKVHRRQFSKYEVLAAVQAQIIYIVMRVIDNSNIEPNLNLELFVTYQMFYIKIGVPCDTFEGFRDIPLPSPKSLWEARTQLGRDSEYEFYKTMPRIDLDRFGDLIDACRQGQSSSVKLKLDAWNIVADSLGFLLNLGLAII
ncbi:hypothetical protein AB5N19_11504 [Seiridium cardinale]|uniref:Uncharacterized protein n=1 Tax=Seiridium cardinale TaxID=138064 RepID=A0ABR2XUV9_9PEZI